MHFDVYAYQLRPSHGSEKILEIFNEVLEGKCGKLPCYNTVENWMKKLGLSVYQNDCKPTEKKFAAIIDESIMVNQEKLLLLLGINILVILKRQEYSLLI